jgi:hypothetical protein
LKAERRRLEVGRQGFTLIEVVCALALMIFLFGGLYGIANGALTLCRSSNDARTAELRLNNLDALLRNTFEELPRSASFELSVAGSDAEGALTIYDAPGILSWRRDFAVGSRVALRTERDPMRKGASRLLVEHWTDSGPGTARPLGELTILSGLESAHWRLLHPETGQWEDLWFPQQGRPVMVEFTFQLSGASARERMVFWIPPFISPEPTQSAQPTAPPAQP